MNVKLGFTKLFGRLSINDAVIAGGKGASLGEMTRASIPVPPGFVVLASAFEKFIAETDIDVEIDAVMHTVRHGEIHTVDEASEKIKALILGAKIPATVAREIKREFKKLGVKFVAVRSSATAEDSASAAWAGQLESYLNTTEKDLLTNVKKCWASLFTPRAIFYRFEKFGDKTHLQKISVAVVVQEMVESEMSGIAFSVHPVTQDYNQLIIEAGLGLGEAIVSGQITPDSYVVEKVPRQILDKNVVTQTRGMFRGKTGGSEWRDVPKEHGEPPTLSDSQILELSDLILKIEKHYGFPCDIEWAYACPNGKAGREKGKFYIVQSRPITTLDARVTKPAYDPAQVKWFKGMERKNLFFVGLAFCDIETRKFGELTGFSIKNFLFKYERGIWSTYRSSEEYKKLYAYFGDLIRKRDARVFEFAELGQKANELASKRIEDKQSIELTINNYEQDYNLFCNALIYGVTIPWAVIGAIEAITDEERVKHEEILKLYEPLRAVSVYPDFEREIIQKYRDKLFKKFRLDEHLLRLLTPWELRETIAGKSLPTKEVLEKRYNYCVYWWDSNSQQIVFSFGRSIEDQIPILKKEAAGDLKMIRGTIAYRGLVQGKVRVVYEIADCPNFQEGEILVSPSTNPTLMPAIKKCSAIITDEGGMTCHAAIISRELKKPCIIGTKIATQVLKDGDLVEVDADNGVVRVLDRAGARKNGTITIGGDDWYLSVTRNMSAWHQFLSTMGHFHNNVDYGIPVPLRILFLTVDGTHTHALLNAENNKMVGVSIFNYLNSPRRIAKLKSDYEKHAASLLFSLQACLKNLSVKNWQKFITDYTRFTAGLYFTVVLGRGGADRLTEALKSRGYSEQQIPRIIAIITYPAEHTPLFESQLDLLKIGREVQQKILVKPIIKQTLESWLKDYGVIPVNFCDEPWTIKDAESQLQNALSKDCASEIARLEKEHNSRVREARTKLKEINDPKITLLAKIVAEGTYLNEFRKNVFSRVSLGYRPIFAELAKRAGLKSWRDCFYLKPEEMEALVAGKELRFGNIHEERRLVGAYVDKNGKRIDLDGKTLADIENYVVAQVSGTGAVAIPTDSVIKGFSASWGVVSGPVKIILSSRDFNKLDPGDILITTMTSVDFVPIMEKAAAFVTNEGGVTSHASIVAREMGKPCIINTKIATQVLKDGDLVEVDAERGIIKILKLAEKESLAVLPSSSKYNKINSKNYDFLWTVGGYHYLFVSIWLTPEVAKRDFIITYKDDVQTCYVSKNQRRELSERGYQLYTDSYESYKKKVNEQITKTRRFLQAEKRKTLPPLSNTELALNFKNLVTYIQNMWVDYFWTEYFCTDKVANVLLSGNQESVTRLKKNTEEMGKLKYLQRELLNEVGGLSTGLLHLYLGETTRRLGIPYEKIIQYHHHEITELLDRGNPKVPDRSVFVIGRFSDWQPILQKEALMLISRLQDFDLAAEEINGSVGNPGVYRGKVKKIDFSFQTNFAEKISRMTKGDVLVSGSTGPEMILACKKAGAIVTDEGGIISHAAIVSRELGIPCVIGTQIATQVLRDGDFVEVDADKGVVRILERKS